MPLLMVNPPPILLLLDRAPWHFAEWTDLIDRLPVVYFPPACPQLNPQAHVWERARDTVSHNHTYRPFQSLIDDFELHLNENLFDTDFMNAFAPLRLGMF